MDILSMLQQLQDGEPKPVAGNDMDFMMPKQQFQKPGMKTQQDLDAYENRMLNGDPNGPNPSDREHENFGDPTKAPQFQGQPKKPNYPSDKDYRMRDSLDDDEAFVKRFGKNRLDYEQRNAPMVREKVPRGSRSRKIDPDTEEFLNDPEIKERLQLQDALGKLGVPSLGMRGMPLEDLRALHTFKKRGGPITDEDQLRQLQLDMNNIRR